MYEHVQRSSSYRKECVQMERKEERKKRTLGALPRIESRERENEKKKVQKWTRTR